MPDCFNVLNSEDYTEFIYRDNYFARKVLESIEDYCITKINEKWSVVSVRNELVGEVLYRNFDYSVFPEIYAPEDVGAINETGVFQIRQISSLSLTGMGTCVAVIDSGINWRHSAFLNPDNSTKIRVIFDEESGRSFEAQDIDRALAGEKTDIPGDETGHGTAMAGIACGSVDINGGFSGAAPFATLIVVKLKQAKKNFRDFYGVKDDATAYSEVDVMRGVQFAIEYASNNNLPMVLLLGIGSSLGAHYGYSPLSDMLSDEALKVGRAVVVSSGNEGNSRLHFYTKTMRDVFSDIELRSRAGADFSLNIWSKPPFFYELEIVSPSGQVVRGLPVDGDSRRVNFVFEATTVFVYGKRFEGLSGANLISLRFKNAGEGIWTLRLKDALNENGEFDAWIMNRSLIGEGIFFLVSNPETTVTDPGNQPDVITVTAYDYRDDSFFLQGSRGYNWYDFVKPDFAVPGVNVLCPLPFSSNGYEPKTGSSIAAALYAGIAALLLEYGVVNGRIPYCRTREIKSITIAGCNRKATLDYPNKIWGYGTVDILNSFEILRR